MKRDKLGELSLSLGHIFELITKLLCIALMLSVALCFCACEKTVIDDETVFNLAEHEELYRNILTSQEAYLESLQLENGAFVKWTDANSEINEVVPYFACFTGLALLENENNAAIVKKYIDWHFSALNRNGDINDVAYTIYDYNTENGVLTSKNSYDSTDSYAALFLMLLDKYAEVTSDNGFVTQRKNDILGVASAMLATMSDGLTTAKPCHAMSYTMDNSEVYAGLRAAQSLMSRIGDNPKAQDFENQSGNLKQQIESRLFSGLYNCYKPYAEALFSNTAKFYPDGAAQLYPAIFGVTNPSDKRAQRLMRELTENYGDEAYKAQIDFPWLFIAYGAYLHGKYAFATSLLRENQQKYMSQNAYPWYSMEGAAAYLTASGLLGALNTP